MNKKVKKVLKKIPGASWFGYKSLELKGALRSLKTRSVATVPDRVLFCASGGKYHDSCKAVAERLHARSPETEIVWLYRVPGTLPQLPDFVTPVKYLSEDCYRELAACSVWVWDCVLPQGIRKRKQQFYIQVWHGDKPMKRIINDAVAANKRYRQRTAGRKINEDRYCDLFTSGTELFVDIWRRSTGYRGKVLLSGLPRNDILLKKDADASGIRAALGLDSGASVLLYAPTFRDSKVDYGVVDTDLDLNLVLEALVRKTGTPWVCLKRAHGGDAITLNNTREDAKILDVTTYPDMTDLIRISDLLITDYSSCAGDFAYTGKPVLLYQDDYERYANVDRGFVIDMEKSPYLRARTMPELLKLIEEITPQLAEQNDRDILEFYRSTQTDHSADDVVSLILEHIEALRG